MYMKDVNQDLNCKVLTNYPMRQDFEILALELKLSKINWLIIGTSLGDIASEMKNILTLSVSSWQYLTYGWF